MERSMFMYRYVLLYIINLGSSQWNEYNDFFDSNLCLGKGKTVSTDWKEDKRKQRTELFFCSEIHIVNEYFSAHCR